MSLTLEVQLSLSLLSISPLSPYPLIKPNILVKRILLKKLFSYNTFLKKLIQIKTLVLIL
jgi:hypothetical protein